VRLLLLSNSGRPFLAWCLGDVADFLGPARTVAFVTAASLGDESAYYERAREALHPARLTVLHLRWNAAPLAVLDRADALFVGGGNTYALLQRLREAGLLDAIRARVRRGLPYVGSSAGSNVSGPDILTTNDWNVVGLGHFDGLGLVPFNINPHYLETDPAMAPFSETRDERIAEYHAVRDNPVVGIEEGTLVRVEAGVATVRGRGRARLFRPRQAPVWLPAGARLDLPRLERGDPASLLEPAPEPP
jgi:dipeptidase E